MCFGARLVQGSYYTWKEEWLPVFLNQLLTLLMFTHVGVNFSPLNETFLTRGFDGTFGENPENVPAHEE
jgi:hypothetical protein